MQTVKQLLDEKGRQLYAISPSATVYEAIERMATHGVGALVVMDGERLVGMLSERDYARKVILQGKSSRDTRVAEIMTAEVITTDEQKTVNDCMQLMTRHRIRHLPVVQDGRVVGMLSIGDLVKAIISAQQFEIEQLSQYIKG